MVIHGGEKSLDQLGGIGTRKLCGVFEIGRQIAAQKIKLDDFDLRVFLKVHTGIGGALRDKK